MGWVQRRRRRTRSSIAPTAPDPAVQMLMVKDERRATMGSEQPEARLIAPQTPISSASTISAAKANMTTITAYMERNLTEQGFGGLDESARSDCVLTLRFTPAISVTLIAIGLGLQSPTFLAAIAIVALGGALFPRAMLFDLFYNSVVRRLFDSPALPPTPRPRQFSYLISTVLLSSSAISFHHGYPVLGFLFGGTVFVAGAVLAVSLFCFGSWLYHLFFGQSS